MPDNKVTELDLIDTVLGTDLVMMIDDPTGVPSNKKASISQVLTNPVITGTVRVAGSVAIDDHLLIGTHATTIYPDVVLMEVGDWDGSNWIHTTDWAETGVAIWPSCTTNANDIEGYVCGIDVGMYARGTGDISAVYGLYARASQGGMGTIDRAVGILSWVSKKAVSGPILKVACFEGGGLPHGDEWARGVVIDSSTGPAENTAYWTDQVAGPNNYAFRSVGDAQSVFGGPVYAPTAPAGTNTNQIATTAFVLANAGALPTDALGKVLISQGAGVASIYSHQVLLWGTGAQLALKPVNSAAYEIGFNDPSGTFTFGRSGYPTYPTVTLSVTDYGGALSLAKWGLLQAPGGPPTVLNFSLLGGQIVFTPSEGGGAGQVQFGRRTQDSNPACGASVECWTSTGQGSNDPVLSVMKPGGASRKWWLTKSGIMWVTSDDGEGAQFFLKDETAPTNSQVARFKTQGGGAAFELLDDVGAARFGLYLANAIILRPPTGTLPQILLSRDTSDSDPSYPRIIGASGAVELRRYDNTDQILLLAKGLVLGSDSAQNGAIRLANNQYVIARNQANTADISIIGLNTTNQIALGATVVPVVDNTVNLGSTPNRWANVTATSFWANTYYGQTLYLGSNAATTGVIRLVPLAAIVSRNAGGTADIELLSLSSSNKVMVGGQDISAPSFSGVAQTQVAFTVWSTVIGQLVFPATTGQIRLQNTATINARNAGNTADIELLKLDAANTVLVGGINVTAHASRHNTGGGDALTALDAAILTTGTLSNARLNANLVATTTLSIGSNYASVGAIRLPNGGYLYSRNAANTADVQMIGVGADNRLWVGSSYVDTLVVPQFGQWTPTITGDGNPNGNTYSTQIGSWVKLGPLVWINFRVAIGVKDPSISGTYLMLSGLPFPGYGGGSMTGGVISYWGAFVGVTIRAHPVLQFQGGTHSYLWYVNSGDSPGYLSPGTLQNGTYIAGSMVYST